MGATRDSAKLQAYLGDHFSPGTVSPLQWGATGASNDTLFFTVTAPDGGEEQYVLRTQSEGHELFYDVDLLFQARVMEGLSSSPELKVPEVVLTEADTSIAGNSFYVMRNVHGRNISVSPSWMAEGWLSEAGVDERRRLWTNAVEMLAQVGRVDWRRDLGFLDRPRRGEPGLDRYLGYVEDWFTWAADGRPQPTVEAALRHVREHQPAQAPLELVWGDATLMNMLWADDLSVASVLDWEMATVGPAELDLGWFLFMADMYSIGFGIPRMEGITGRDESIVLYADKLGRPLDDDIRYYEILGALRMSIVTIRFADLQVRYGTLPPDTTLGTNNPATVVLAKYLGIEGVENDPLLSRANAAVVNAERGGG